MQCLGTSTRGVIIYNLHIVSCHRIRRLSLHIVGYFNNNISMKHLRQMLLTLVITYEYIRPKTFKESSSIVLLMYVHLALYVWLIDIFLLSIIDYRIDTSCYSVCNRRFFSPAKFFYIDFSPTISL